MKPPYLSCVGYRTRMIPVINRISDGKRSGRKAVDRADGQYWAGGPRRNTACCALSIIIPSDTAGWLTAAGDFAVATTRINRANSPGGTRRKIPYKSWGNPIQWKLNGM